MRILAEFNLEKIHNSASSGKTTWIANTDDYSYEIEL
jgi:hypothetical protein